LLTSAAWGWAKLKLAVYFIQLCLCTLHSTVYHGFSCLNWPSWAGFLWETSWSISKSGLSSISLRIINTSQNSSQLIQFSFWFFSPCSFLNIVNIFIHLCCGIENTGVFLNQKDLRNMAKSIERKDIFVQIKIMGTDFSLWTIVPTSLKLPSVTSMLFLPKYDLTYLKGKKNNQIKFILYSLNMDRFFSWCILFSH
jgi:hypothetical protein